MGKLQSKHACKRRENPEGGTFATSALLFQRESADHSESHRSQHKQNMECNVPIVDENRQEWVFTLYDLDNTGRVTKEDMSGLMHTICEVVDASVKQSELSNSKTLRVKLSVTPSVSSNKRDRDTGSSVNRRDHPEESHPCHIRGKSPDLPGISERKLYCTDENSERRNHYLDLAGIENYTCKFETDYTLQSPAEEQGQEAQAHAARTAPQRRSQPDACGSGTSGGRGVTFLASLRGRCKSTGAGGVPVKPSRLHGHHPVSWCNPAEQQQHSHGKRVRARLRDTPSPQPARGLDRDLHPGAGAPPAGFLPIAQKHEHHHLHEHHHHHHHHHHYYSS
ncbi:protein naked cuticle homolog 2 isoform X2 [Brachyhypopomus gauderio]|uniref:protein naked cuticle homolog 2 isoform X2 n=1 Tax=Brachyhypopomus gauderio TaxID=698409 RepID=UPI00404324C1